MSIESNQQIFPITGVGLGPGDAELITVKGLKALQQADVVYYPATSKNEGKLTSYSLKILENYHLKAHLKPMLFPMKSKRRIEYYDFAYKAIRTDALKGLKVAVVSEGDLLFYSTFGYLLPLAKADSIECELIPGIPAFIHSASIGQIPLVEEQEDITVIARPDSFSQVERAIEEHSTVVVMKMSILKDDWVLFLKNCNRPFFYIEKAGTSEQFTTSNASELENREIPYFSLVIFTSKSV
ncbi:precorrin-2 C(20)-methyltransferase [Alkalitalea saponilacus]|uniref:Precorrin-2/cobalt-factor-2 C20-methyltransferase n=1 Tax=Alkalitalea saponilacus TaxID=889453 RepID=A0A1T5GMN4_9BACT|nr:precorrin-2 C(20)-methyltransferase [Alkalitalea saponilacus]ASB48267.1 precorrin-2 C(20)-methyltransferase [Alkalitalea saponilacus]SKC09641.1 precorrin-2/cobalt-factor-2 C20-methyltransferase [Alkalitalea saponilacus]